MFVYFFCCIGVVSIFLSYFYKINLSNLFLPTEINQFFLEYNISTRSGGVVSDFKTHWDYIQALRNDIKNLFLYEMGKDTKLINFPLHNIIFSQIYFLTDNLKNFLFFFLIVSLFLPYIFYKNLFLIFKKLDKKTLIIISSLILILPAYQYSAIWGSSHITALCFFLIGTFYHIKFEQNHQKKRYIYFSIIFFALSAYTKQFYVFIFLFIFLKLFFDLKKKHFLYLSSFSIFLAIPGFIFLYFNPLLYYGIKQEITNLSGSILISSSICFFYMIPFIVQYVINLKKFKKIFETKNIILAFLILLINIPTFVYNSNIGGGIFYKLSLFFFESKYFFYLFAYLGLYFLFFFTKKNISSYFLTIIFISTFSTGFFIFQKYFEPLFLIIFFLYFDKKKILVSINKNNYLTIFYYLFYYIVINYIYFFGL